MFTPCWFSPLYFAFLCMWDMISSRIVPVCLIFVLQYFYFYVFLCHSVATTHLFLWDMFHREQTEDFTIDDAHKLFIECIIYLLILFLFAVVLAALSWQLWMELLKMRLKCFNYNFKATSHMCDPTHNLKATTHHINESLHLRFKTLKY